MFVSAGHIFRSPGDFLYKVLFPYRAVGDAADGAGDGLAVIHMEVELNISFDAAGQQDDHLFHFLMGIPQAVIPGQGNVGVNMQRSSELLDLEIMDVDPFRAPVFFQHFYDFPKQLGILFIHNTAQRFADDLIADINYIEPKQQCHNGIQPVKPGEINHDKADHHTKRSNGIRLQVFSGRDQYQGIFLLAFSDGNVAQQIIDDCGGSDDGDSPIELIQGFAHNKAVDAFIDDHDAGNGNQGSFDA